MHQTRPQHIEYHEGSIRELWYTSLPLMLSWLSVVLMTFVDRLYLANYSIEAHNSTVTASTMAWAFTMGIQTLCEMSQVFVAQYNGSKQWRMLGKPIWQMLWLTLASSLLFFPIGYWGSHLLFHGSPNEQMQVDYFRTLIFFAPANGLIGATSAFYIGRGRTGVVTWVVIIGNIINVLLDPILIFGIPGWIPSLGVFGAALATGLGGLLQGVILLVCFTQKKNRLHFGTGDWHFSPNIFGKCLKVGLPTAITLVLELTAWGLFYMMMSYASSLHILVSGVCQSILIVLFFFGLGLEKGMATITGNLIGSGRQDKIPTLIRSGFFLIFGFSILTAIPLLIYPDTIIQLFLQYENTIESSNTLNGMPTTISLIDTMPLLRTGLLITFVYLLFEHIRFVMWGTLIASGDTLFLSIANVAVIWIFLLVPTYFAVFYFYLPVTEALLIWVLFSATAATIPIWRYWQGGWKKHQLIQTEPVYGS